MDVRDDTTAGDRCLDERIQFFVSADGQLQVARCDALDAEILGRVTGEFEDLGGEVLEDGSAVHGGSGTDAAVAGRAALQVTVDPADRELQSGALRAGDGLGLRLSRVLTSFTSSHLDLFVP